MATIFAVSYTKGGVGKTALTVNAGAILAASGLRVLLVDMDPQGCIAGYFQIRTGPQARTMADVLSGNATILQAIRNVRSNLDILPADLRLADIAHGLENQPRGLGRFSLARVLAVVRGHYDSILIDTPPTLGIFMQVAIAAADKLIIPVESSIAAVQTIGQIFAIRERMQELARAHGHRYYPDVACVVLSKYAARFIEDETAANALYDYMQARRELSGIPIYTIRHRAAVGRAWNLGLPLTEYLPETDVLGDYRAVAAHIQAVAKGITHAAL
jgi:chromosome partitioning protein